MAADSTTLSPRLGIALLLAALLAGCSDDKAGEKTSVNPSTDSADTGTANGTVNIPSFAKADLVQLGGYLPPLDEDRIKVAPPVDWKVQPRSKDYVTQFVYIKKSRNLPLPRITIEFGLGQQ